MTLVADSLFKYMETISNIKLNDFTTKQGDITSKNLRYTDNDIGEAMNLLWPIRNFQMYYPKVIFKNDTTIKKPAILSIDDSFTQSFFGFYPFFENVFGEQSQFWYYFRVVSWPESIASQYIQVANYDLRYEVLKYDFILFVSTEQNLGDIGYGFIEKIYLLLRTNISDYETKLQGYILTIKSSPQWLEAVTKKAKENDIEIEEMIRRDAVWMVEQEQN